MKTVISMTRIALKADPHEPKTPKEPPLIREIWVVCKCGHLLHGRRCCGALSYEFKPFLVTTECLCRKKRRDFVSGNVSLRVLLDALDAGKLQEIVQRLKDAEEYAWGRAK